MAVVKKMYVSGVRSFHPQDNKQQMIEFQTPLTLILGVNGSGKTTIIEALKYGITNSFPPNSKLGASFVNDPKLTNGYETTGSVKLEVRDGRGCKVETSRRVKVTLKDKQGNLTKKELDSTIKISDGKGSTKEISSKCADTKAEMCRIMGVSEAILNNVILCHQEDSCWPLDEGKKVKEKFDAIFNTTMYIKCLDQLGKQDKELGMRAKLENEKLTYVIENRTIARRKKKELEAKQIELQSFTDKIEGQEKEIKEMETRLNQLRQLETEYMEISNKVSVTEGKLEAIQKQVAELKSNIKEEFSGDISAIERAISEFKTENKTKLYQQKQLQQTVRGKEEDLKKLSLQQKTFILEEGKFQQEQEGHNERMENMISLISDVVKLVKKLKEGSQDTSFSSSMDSCIDVCDADPRILSPEIVVKALASAVRARDSEINKLKTRFDTEEKELQSNIDTLRSKRASIEKELEMKTNQIKENNLAVEDIRSRLRDIEGSNAALEELEYEEGKVAKEIDAIQDAGSLEKYELEIKKLTTEISQVDSQITEAADDFELLSKDKGILDQIEIYNNQRGQKKNDCRKILGRIEDDLNTVLGGEIPEVGLERAFDKKRESVIAELTEKKIKQREDEKKIALLQMDLKRIKTDLSQKETKFERKKDDIEDILEGRDFDEVYNEAKDELDEMQKNNYYAEAAVFLYKKHIQKLNKSDCCPLCKRDTDNKRQTQDLIKQIQTDIQNIQQKDPAEKAEISKLQIKLKDLLAMKPIWDENQTLKDEIPSLKRKVSTLESELAETTEAAEDFNLLVADLENSKAIFDKRIKDVHLIESAQVEVKQREESIAKLEASRNPKAKSLSLTLNLSSAKTRLQDFKNTLKSKQMDKDSKSNLLNNARIDLNRLNVKKNEARQKILKITSELQNREALETQKKDLEAANKQITEANSSLKQGLPKVKSEITDAEESKSKFVEKKDKQLSMARNERDSLERQRVKLYDIGQQNEEFDRKKSLFVDIQRRAAACKHKVDELLAQKSELDTELESINNAIISQESTKRNLDDNLNYKKKLQDVSKLESELEEKRKLFESTQNQGVIAERRQLAQKHTEKFAQMNRLMGSKKEIQTVIHDLRKELKDRPYVNAETEYVDKLVKKTVFEKAQKDVRRYKTALDQAIMMFHRQRMEMINQALWEYWRRIYKGNDIDYIQIRTEAGSGKPDAGAGHKVKIDTGKGRKSYNYRVVMVRRGTELDMRGRCSAGQRVLASIIIRIALADSFSSRCGVITLDEPTTNLDQKNINSLADALSSLAEKMSQKQSFQLIVITHDQEFTERLSSIDAVEKYWKVSRDNMGFSQITMVPKRG